MIKFSQYKNQSSTENQEIDINNYVGFIKAGFNQDLVLNARAALERGEKDEYKKLKMKSQAITGSCTIPSGKTKVAANVEYMNGLIVLDIDEEISEEKYFQIKNDPHTFVIHRSFSGKNFCVFVKIDSQKFEASFYGLAEYYATYFDVTIDQACKNINRLRYMSYDPDIFYNEKSKKFIAKDIKRYEAPKEVNYVFHNDDFDNILQQVKDRSIDLCADDYVRHVRIGMSLASHFGEDGLDKFKLICSFGSKYNERKCERTYKGFCKNTAGQSTIGTFYYFAKDAGIEVYTEKTKTIINRVKIAKSQGNPTTESIASNLRVANNIEASDEDYKLIALLISSNNDYSKEANSSITEIEQLQNFIIEKYSPSIDIITNVNYINGDTHRTDIEINDIYIDCKKSFEFNINIADIRAILNSSAIKKINVLEKFLDENKGKKFEGFLDDYINCIHPRSPYNVWAFKKWIVGGLHNWTSHRDEVLVCPLTLVLTGRQHGTGKTSWFRNLLPIELSKYRVENKINGHDKDSMYTMCCSLLLYDDEFGGKSFKDEKEFKQVSDQNSITQRRPYEREPKTFKRRTLLGGSTNEEDILKDVTGNRRILPVNVIKIDYDRMLEIDKTGIIMEAYNLLLSGFDWKVRTQEDIDYIKANCGQNEMVNPIEEIFFKHFSVSPTPIHSRRVIMNQGDILDYLSMHSAVKPTKHELRDVYIKAGISYKSHRIGDDVKKGVELYIETVYDPRSSDMPF